MEKEASGKKWIRRGLIIGTVAGSVYALANKNSRTKITKKIDGGTHRIRQLVEVFQENREPFIEQLKHSGQKIQQVIENASDDIENLVTASRHMKEHSKAIIEALQETKEDFQELTEQLENSSGTAKRIEVPAEGQPALEEGLPLPEELPAADRGKLN